MNWNAAKADLTNRLEKTMEDYKKASTEKTTVEEMRKSLTEARGGERWASISMATESLGNMEIE